MTALSARRLGYRIHSFSPDRGTPCGEVSDAEIVAGYDDESAVRDFARNVDVLTFEFENIPVQCAEWAGDHCTVRPAGRVLHICQHRQREKDFLRTNGFPLPRFFGVGTEIELRDGLAHFEAGGVLKTAAFGYDGKGQRMCLPGCDPKEIWQAFQQPCVLEEKVSFEREVSVVVARSADGSLAVYPVCENRHAHHVLDITLVPAQIPEQVARNARSLAERIATAIDLVGLLAVEMFLMPDGTLLVNELAPRPHNSGHYSFDFSVTSQFEQHVRSICGLGLGSTESLRPAAMANLLGDVWDNGEPNWAGALAIPEVKLHLYGKHGPRPGRKMGHLTACGETLSEAEVRVRTARTILRNPRA